MFFVFQKSTFRNGDRRLVAYSSKADSHYVLLDFHCQGGHLTAVAWASLLNQAHVRASGSLDILAIFDCLCSEKLTSAPLSRNATWVWTSARVG